ncbi:hypothetical protein [Micromonospora sp. WMMD812]|uniref:hypothetical protein n=1 Tax=Micromonospora sp. WMMD812 TaxID=3015152 RepID=UPI00248C0356|nr:hypothetical protein [Micromonospora sp. WMMD812]WBB69187.1 hypothetical protein O7603_07520 [Micromonospora sp. WMMD812]
MPPSTPLTVVTVCFAPGDDADWFAASEKVYDVLHANGTPACRYRVRHRHLIGWLTRFLSYHLLDTTRRFGAITTAAGGRKGRLDLTRTAATAAHDAAHRWRVWNTHINATTKPARAWEAYLAQHHADPKKVSLAEARRRFEQQPHVLAMLAHSLNPYELSIYQAGEATYSGLYWRIALIGDALITTDGRLLLPASDSVADRFRFLNEACGYLRSLRSNTRLCAIAIAIA